MRAGRGPTSGDRLGRRRSALGCTRLGSATSGGSGVSPAHPPRRALRGAGCAALHRRCKGGAWLETPTGKRRWKGTAKKRVYLSYSWNLCLISSSLTPLHCNPDNLKEKRCLLCFLNSGKSCAFQSHPSPPCAVRPLLSGVSPGELTLRCRLDILVAKGFGARAHPRSHKSPRTQFLSKLSS